jgi:ornithine--oxo-acid transaminase
LAYLKTHRTFAEEIDYMQGVYDLCKCYNILFVADEVRMGVCRTGRFNSSDYLADGCKPDMMILGKSITGGVYPASYILGKEEVMTVVGQREIVQTFAFSPLAVAASSAILEIVDEENLAEKSTRLGALFLEKATQSGWQDMPCVQYITARGAELAIWFREDSKEACQAVATFCMHNGLLMFPKDTLLRMCPPLVISEELFARALEIVDEALVKHASSMATVTFPKPDPSHSSVNEVFRSLL